MITADFPATTSKVSAQVSARGIPSLSSLKARRWTTRHVWKDAMLGVQRPASPGFTPTAAPMAPEQIHGEATPSAGEVAALSMKGPGAWKGGILWREQVSRDVDLGF